MKLMLPGLPTVTFASMTPVTENVPYRARDVRRQQNTALTADHLMAPSRCPLLEQPVAESTDLVGLDVGADVVHACVTAPDGTILYQKSLANCPGTVGAFLAEIAPGTSAQIGMEAGTYSTHLARKLREAGHDVTVFETRQSAQFLKISRNKTDANDARSIAHLMRVARGLVSESHIKSIEIQRLRSTLMLRDRMIIQRVAFENTLKSILRLYGNKLPRCASAKRLRRETMAAIERIHATEGFDLSSELTPAIEICASIRAYEKAMGAELLRRAESIEICRRFMQIPGVGPITALSYYSAIENPLRFSHVEKVGAYLGLAPKVHQSGEKAKRSRISAMGDARTRAHLIGAAGHLIQARAIDTDLKRWGVGLRARIGSHKARTALARKLAVVMLAMWKTGEDFRAVSKLDVGGGPNSIVVDQGIGHASDTSVVDEKTSGSILNRSPDR